MLFTVISGRHYVYDAQTTASFRGAIGKGLSEIEVQSEEIGSEGAVRQWDTTDIEPDGTGPPLILGGNTKGIGGRDRSGYEF